MRRTQLAVGLALLLDALLYLAVLPLLPDWSERFALSKLGAGVVLAAYPVAALALVIPAGILPARIGGRAATLLGDALFAAATIALALAPSATAIAVARALQGAASSISWVSAMAWLTTNAPPQDRGRATARAASMLAVGSLIGPVVGALASTVGERPVFLGVAAAAVVAAIATVAAPRGLAPPPEEDLVRSFQAAAREPLVRIGLVLALIDACGASAIDLLVPLELGRRGLDGQAIGTVLTGLAVASIVGARVAGRMIGARGPLAVAVAAAIGTAVTTSILAFTLPTVVLVALFTISGGLLAALLAALYPVVAAGADRAGVGHSIGNSVAGAGWALGAALAPVVAGAIAQAAGDPLAYVAATVVAVLLLGLVARLRRGASGALDARVPDPS